MFPDPTLKLLSLTEVFHGLTNEDLFMLLHRYSSERSFNKGETIIHEGREESALYVVLEGKLKVLLSKRHDQEGSRAKRVRLNILSPGDCFGDYSLIDGKPASASVIGVDPGRLLVISQNNFVDLVSSSDRVGMTLYRNLLRLAIKRIRRKDEELNLVLALV